MNMARKNENGDYQIGMYEVRRVGRNWEAWATGALGDYSKIFPTLAAAHLDLTGEPMRETLHRRYSEPAR